MDIAVKNLTSGVMNLRGRFDTTLTKPNKITVDLPESAAMGAQES